jgi:multiple antibiotic resistance protein
MITPLFIFTVFMLTLGPIKTVPAFFAMTQDQAPASARALALQGTMVATAVSIAIAVVMTGIAASWRVSPDDLRIAGGILLFTASREMIGSFGRPASPPQSAKPPQHPAITPLAIPIIVTPWGVAAILFFADLAYDDLTMSAIVVGILLLVMLLNLIGMLLAGQIIARVGMISFQVLGWIMAVLQAAFAVDAVVTSARNLALFHPIP